jgi:hypothetical protein
MTTGGQLTQQLLVFARKQRLQNAPSCAAKLIFPNPAADTGPAPQHKAESAPQ